MKKEDLMKLLDSSSFIRLAASVIFTVVALVVCLTNYVFTSLFPRHYYIDEDKYDQIARRSAVQCSADTLYYSGYDYYIHDKIVAHYYYALENNTCTVFLISSSMSDSGAVIPPTLKNVTFYANVRNNDPYLKQLMDYLATDLEWNSYSLSKYTNTFILSQYHYNRPWLIFMACVTTAGILYSLYVYKTQFACRDSYTKFRKKLRRKISSIFR